ncbi:MULTISPECIES: cytochrome c oxidase assembly protein [Mesobacillus]|uniref:cytochrome c oxidase assembly protein n=1 Tax=Mesobacillus TaxID=2675231 RepID=UPI00069C933C|nr:cytochrome c oxidase assembly protein [Mesobacillus subterraneus]
MNMEYKSAGELVFDWNIFVILIGIVIILYYNHKQRTTNFHISQKQKLSFYTGAGLFIFALGTPIDAVGDYLFSVHMVIQSIIYLAVPPLILYGLPDKELEVFFSKRSFLKRTNHILTKPILALLLFNGFFSFYHVPFIFDFIMGSSLYMTLSIIFLLILSFIMWWPVVSPVKSMDNMKPLYKIAYVCGMGILLTPACALIIFSKELLYNSYLHSPSLFGVSSLDDQQAGGALMKIIQEIIYGTVIAFIFFAWAKDQRNDEIEDRLEKFEEEYLSSLRKNQRV